MKFNLRSHPATAELSPAKKIESYLTYRVLEDDVKPATQNVEFNALVLFYAANGVKVEGINALRARRRDYIPPNSDQGAGTHADREFSI